MTLLDTDPVIERIYDTVEDLGAWDDVLSRFCEWVCGESAILGFLMKRPRRMSVACLFRIDPELTASFNTRHIRDHPWMEWTATSPVCVPVASEVFMPLNELRRTDFFGEILEPQAIAHGAFIKFDDAPSFVAGMSIHRPAAAGPFTAGEFARSEPLLPHLRRAMQLRILLERSESHHRLALDALDRATPGILLVDAFGRVIFANRAALELTATLDAIVLQDRGIVTRHRAQTRHLQTLIGSAAGGGPGGAMAVARASGGLPITVLVAPLKGALALAAAADGLTGAAAIFLTDPERHVEPSAERLVALYGFTPTEARVALQIARAGTIPEAAAALRLAPETVRTHLKRIYAKTGINRQSALMRLLTAGAALRPV